MLRYPNVSHSIRERLLKILRVHHLHAAATAHCKLITAKQQVGTTLAPSGRELVAQTCYLQLFRLIQTSSPPVTEGPQREYVQVL
jgi:hypothetical protein